MLIDSHAHLDFYDDPAPILARAAAAGVHQILAIGIGDGPLTMHRALEIARTHNQIYASAGIHPQQAHQASPEALKTLRALAQEPKCIAIGEIGLDYYHAGNPDILTQQAVFGAQLEIAADHKKPILIHCRTSELATPAAKARFGPADAFADLMELIGTRWSKYGIPGVMHCFSGSPAEAQQALAAGFYLSFAGNLTYPRSEGIRQAATAAPADRILVETDCPFLAPIPLRGQQNEPAFVTHTAAFLAQLRGISPEDLAALTTQNFHTLFPSTAAGLE
jgi:TatD DNase family protein